MATHATTDDGASSASTTPVFPAGLVLKPETLLRELTTRQHLRPHRPLRAVLSDIRACPDAAERAMEWLGLDGDTAVGRVKRAQLIQLARSLHRMWKRAVEGQNPSH